MTSVRTSSPHLVGGDNFFVGPRQALLVFSYIYSLGTMISFMWIILEFYTTTSELYYYVMDVLSRIITHNIYCN